MNRKIIISLCVFILSRVLFINPLPIFFDSPEYLNRFSNPDYLQAIVSGHMPFHAGYIMLFWPIFHVAKSFSINPSSAIIIAQIIFSAISIYCFYRVVEIVANRKIAIISSIISSLTPLYWISNASIMTESTYINFFIISSFFMVLYARKKVCSNPYLFAGCISFGLALLTNPLVILWTPLLLSIVYFLKKEKTVLTFTLIMVSIFIVILANGLFTANAFHVSLQNGIYQYLFKEDIRIAPDFSSYLMILRFARNALISSMQNNTSIILILGIISLMQIFKRNKKLFFISFLWIFPSMLTGQWFDPLLFGRHGMIAAFGFAFLAGIFLEKRKILSFATIGYVILVSLPAIGLLKQPIPYLEMGRFITTLPKGLFIETHLARPQIEGRYSGEILFINQPGWSRKKLEAAIDNHLKDNKPIFITSQALSDPYGLYSGPFIYTQSLSYTKKFELESVMSSYSTEMYAAINAGDVTIYKIVSKNASKYPNIQKLSNSRRRIGYFDPIGQSAWFFIERANIIQSQNIIKG